MSIKVKLLGHVSKSAGVCLLATALLSCQTLDDYYPAISANKTSVPSFELTQDVPVALVNTEPRKLTFDGIKALEKGDLDVAKENFNKALKMDIRNSNLQFLNALTYHLRALNGNSQDFELALTGYRLAQQFEPSNWIAVFYEGLLYKDIKKFEQAQDAFARAMLLERNNPDILFQFAEVSYYANDIKSAVSAIKQLTSLDLGDDLHKKLFSVGAIVHAGANMPRKAADYLTAYKGLSVDAFRLDYIEKRIEAWNDFHRRQTYNRNRPILHTAQFALPDDEDDPFNQLPPVTASPSIPVEKENPIERNAEIEREQEEPDNSGTESDDITNSPVVSGEERSDETQQAVQQEAENPNPMVVVDVVILRTEDDNSTSKGVNLLSGLKIQFGDPLAGVPGLSYRKEKVADLVDPTDTVNTRTVTRFISLPSVSYSLNIANSATGRNEILARPTLVAMSGETSEFFSGVQIAAAAVSGGAGDSISIDKEVGVKLAITPEILENDFVRLDVSAERTFLTQPSSSVTFNFRLDTTKTEVNAAVSMKFGQTLILGGLSEREKEGDRDGVPLLQEIPVVQYLFSRKTTRDYNKSVLILITPRRAHAVDQTPEEFEKSINKLGERERNIEKLSYEFRDWFQPTPNVDSVFQHMQNNDLYREFKRGDFPPESWSGQQGHFDRLRHILPFLYY